MEEDRRGRLGGDRYGGVWSIDPSRIAPMVGFFFDSEGLMYNFTLEGQKITRIRRWQVISCNLRSFIIDALRG
jgi:hypothetical protein